VFIYVITNDVNDKAYVGLHSGTDLNKRWGNHLASARMGESCALYNAIRKYGENKFHITAIWSGYILPDKLKMLERYYIRCFQTMRPNGYNLTEGGDGSFGFRHSEEHKQSMRGRPFSQETRQKMSRLHKGKTISAEQRRTVSEKMRGNKHLLGHRHSEETRAKLSIAGRKRIVTEEMRAKLSRLAKERGDVPPQDPATREKRRLANTGLKRSPEFCAQMSRLHKGRPKSEETKRKLSEATKKFYAEKRKKSNEVNNQPRSLGGTDDA
jgi:group I intron endonuclease